MNYPEAWQLRQAKARSQGEWNLTPRRPLTPDSGEYEFRLSLQPGHNTFKYLQEKAAKEGVWVTNARGALDDRDGPTLGTVAVMPRDEREAKYGKPLMLADLHPHKSPLLIVGGAASHWQALKEKADEMRHYREDYQDDQTVLPWQEIWNRLIELKRHRARGRRMFAQYQGKRAR